MNLVNAQQQRSGLRKLGAGLVASANELLPNSRAIDAAFRRLRFFQANRRLPRHTSNPAATFNDLILARMTQDDWSPLERTCVDKEYAKLIAAALSPAVRLSQTLRIIALEPETGAEVAREVLSARSGRDEVAKPTHGSGAVLFLRDRPPPQTIAAFCHAASRSYYAMSRESQYRGLKRKIIVEEDLSGESGAPEDYKFFCSHGEVLFCQVDVGRFTRHRRRLVTPDFTPIDVRFAYDWPETMPEPPHNFAEMCRVAQELSRLFPFVRIDLYSIGNVVYFGEFTFAPEGGAGALSCEAFGIAVMERIRACIARQEAEA